jgi:hypothetical protein
MMKSNQFHDDLMTKNVSNYPMNKLYMINVEESMVMYSFENKSEKEIIFVSTYKINKSYFNTPATTGMI